MGLLRLTGAHIKKHIERKMEMRITKALIVLILPLISHGALSAALMDANPQYFEYVEATSTKAAIEAKTTRGALSTEKINLQKQLKDLELTKEQQEQNVKELTAKAIKEGDAPLGNLQINITAIETEQEKLDITLKAINAIKVNLKINENKLNALGRTCLTNSQPDSYACRIRRGEIEIFSDLGVSPTLADGGEIKLGALRGFIDFGQNRKMPISVIIADVTSQTQSEEANATKLLDPEQGINLTSEFAWRYGLLGVCSGDTTARCMFGFNYGIRYLKLQEEGTDQSISTYGGFVTFKTSAAFNIFKIGGGGSLSTDSANQMGTIRFYGSASYFYHNGSSSDDFFSGIVDKSGNPIQFDREYGSIQYGLAIYVNDSINFTYSKYSARATNGLMDEESISLNFDVLKFK